MKERTKWILALVFFGALIISACGGPVDTDGGTDAAPDGYSGARLQQPDQGWRLAMLDLPELLHSR